MTTPSTTPNRLANESSPYLLQHASNPVDWYPWGDEALERARQEDKPIFLSIGYSACHWCHVMEHESFEDQGIASLLNDNYVCIKVDREERPDLDQIYMNAVMALQGGGGGWPLSVFLTPDQAVFFGGTYWPPTSRMGMPGFDHVLHSVLDAFTSRRDQVTEQSRKITAWLNEEESTRNEVSPTRDLLVNAGQTLARHFDYQDGGFGGAPRFPHAMDLRLLVLLSKNWPPDLTPDSNGLLEMVKIACERMAYGGIFDHLGGGFARYSVDEKWLVPHFEKMLYDNSLLVDVYLEMFQVTGDLFYRMVTENTLDYLLHYLTDESGAFYSTEDADSEGVEGKFYVWSKSEVIQILGDEIGNRFCEFYDVTESGNFEGQNILNMKFSFQDFVGRKENAASGGDVVEFQEQMRDARQKLLKVRDRRVRPGRDDKVLVSWNGLAIHAMARAAVILGEPKYGLAAENAADFIMKNMRTDDGRLLHTWRGGQAKLAAYLDDYSNLIVALIELYQVGHDEKWIGYACELAEQMVSHFSDHHDEAFYFTADDHEKLIARSKSFQDSSVPSGNSMAALALLRLGRLTGRASWVERAQRTMSAAVPLMQKTPMANGQMLIGVQQLLDDARELVLVAHSRDDLGECVERIRKLWLPSSILLVRCDDGPSPCEVLEDVLGDKQPIDGRPTLYVCSSFSCQQPIVGEEKILSWIESWVEE